ncbi:MAG: tail fiber protein [Beijerinckiaceae bacterium]|nr:tail fiber protein [Beijerinckiaceae bacterium]
MSEPYLGEIQAFAFPWANQGFNQTWAVCAGQTLAVSQYSALFALIGTTYGGNGTTTFNLPNLIGNIATSQGQGPGLTNRIIGEQLGWPNVTLTAQQIARHGHSLQVGIRSAPNAAPGPGTGGSTTAIDPDFNGFVASPVNTTLSPTAMAMTGGNGAHDNNQPTLAIVYCIALYGIYPNFG